MPDAGRRSTASGSRKWAQRMKHVCSITHTLQQGPCRRGGPGGRCTLPQTLSASNESKVLAQKAPAGIRGCSRAKHPGARLAEQPIVDNSPVHLCASQTDMIRQLVSRLLVGARAPTGLYGSNESEPALPCCASTWLATPVSAKPATHCTKTSQPSSCGCASASRPPRRPLSRPARRCLGQQAGAWPTSAGASTLHNNLNTYICVAIAAPCNHWPTWLAPITRAGRDRQRLRCLVFAHVPQLQLG